MCGTLKKCIHDMRETLKTNEIPDFRINKNVSYNLEIQVTLLKYKS